MRIDSGCGSVVFCGSARPTIVACRTDSTAAASCTPAVVLNRSQFAQALVQAVYMGVEKTDQMIRYIALLRGLNVGGHRVKMDRLRSVFEELGFQHVSTVLASGNVIFSTQSDDADALRAAIERRLGEELGYEVAAFLRTPEELAAIPAFEPGGNPPQSESSLSHYVIFLLDPAPESLRSGLEGLSSKTDTFHFDGREVHWLIRGKLSESPLFAGAFDRATRGIPNTMRNMNTIRKLVTQTAPPAAG